jgi:hypothetical protein
MIARLAVLAAVLAAAGCVSVPPSAGRVSLAAAQLAIAADWETAP